jgi:hypothetical protein
MLELIGTGTGAAGVTDLLLPRHHLEHVARKLATSAPQVDLEGHGVAPRLLLDHPLQGRVRDEAAVPVVLAFDLDRGKTGRQRAARHDVLGADRVRRAVEIDEIAGAHVDRPDAETCDASIQAVEIHQMLERALEIFGVIEAGGLDRPAGLQPRRHRPHGEKSACSVRERHGGAHLAEKIARGIASRESEICVPEKRPKPVRGHLGPKLAQPIDAGIRRIAGNDGRIDRPDRDASDPVGMYAGL